MQKLLSNSDKFSIYYHNIFDYPLNQLDLIKWHPGSFFGDKYINAQYKFVNGCMVIKGREGLIYKKILRKRVSKKKLIIAKKSASILSFIPTIKMIGVTGSLAMDNSTEESDIDLMIITQKNTLWLTRLISYLFLTITCQKIRTPKNNSQKDKLCINIWLDEDYLIWENNRSHYTAHEIAQIIPLVNKEKVYEKFIWDNRWVKNYWPNAIKIEKCNSVKVQPDNNFILLILEKFAYKLQLFYMKNKITREVITPSRALFHPKDWSSQIALIIDEC